MRRSLLSVFLTGGSLIAVGPLVWAQPTPSAGTSYRPFTATIRTTYIDEEGGEKHFLESFARKSDGSYAEIRETEAYEGERARQQFIFSLTHRTYTRADAHTESLLVLPLVEQLEFLSFLESPGTCRGLTDGTWKRVGESERLGIRVIEVEAQASDNVTTKLWVAPELECFPLLDVLLEKGVVRTKKEVVSLKLGDPDPAAFQVPSGYAQVTPLQFEELWRRRYPGKEYYGDEQAGKLERKYREGKARLERPADIR